jgi:hypothetical protein
MTYTKPEVSIIGNASEVILGTKNSLSADAVGAQPQNAIPAYDLDE